MPTYRSWTSKVSSAAVQQLPFAGGVLLDSSDTNAAGPLLCFAWQLPLDPQTAGLQLGASHCFPIACTTLSCRMRPELRLFEGPCTARQLAPKNRTTPETLEGEMFVPYKAHSTIVCHHRHCLTGEACLVITELLEALCGMLYLIAAL